MKRIALRASLFALAMIAAPFESRAQSCEDFALEIVTSITQKLPCPSSAAGLPRFESAVNNRVNLLKNGIRSINRALKTKAIDPNVVTAQLLDYAAQCRASLGGGGETPVDEQPRETPAGGLADVCATTSVIGAGQMLIKSEISDHINSGDPRATGYTVVCAADCPKNLRKTDFFYADGSYAGSVGYYGTFSGNGRPRLYGAAGGAEQHFVSQIAPKAAGIGNGKLYMQMSSATSGPATSCKEFNPTGRNGSL
jgi:hypothetical protein